MKIKLPDGWEIFYDDVCRKVKTLTASGVWSADASVVLAWLANFKADEHRYIAAHILDRTTFRTEKMLEGGYKRFLATSFRETAMLHLGTSNINIRDWFEILREHPKGIHSNLLLCPVTKAGESGDSGNHIVRILTGELFNQHRTLSPFETPLSNQTNNLILIVDDFVGSGVQFKEFADKTNLKEAARNNKIVYAPAIAYYKGLQSIYEENYGIDIIPLEILGKSEQFFQHENGIKFCGDDINAEQDVLACYQEMRLLDPGFGRGGWLGRDRASLSVMFQWGCPNQSLGIMWYQGSNPWNRLARRRGAQ
ncbi:MAG: hypothetical protein Q7W55_13645 [Pseudohongiella sp.]|nr:hypothetical protein [Pseudohongiella sp.]